MHFWTLCVVYAVLDTHNFPELGLITDDTLIDSYNTLSTLKPVLCEEGSNLRASKFWFHVLSYTFRTSVVELVLLTKKKINQYNLCF